MIVPQTYKHWCSKVKISNTLFLPKKLDQLVLKTQTTGVPAQSLQLQHKAPAMNTYTQMAMDIIIMMLKKMSVGLNQGHLRSTQPFPPSSYSCLDTHICWKEPCNNKRHISAAVVSIMQIQYSLAASPPPPKLHHNLGASSPLTPPTKLHHNPGASSPLTHPTKLHHNPGASSPLTHTPKL